MRIVFASVVGLVGLTAYLVGAVSLAARVASLHWALQALYFALAGVLWALPASGLMLWAARKPERGRMASRETVRTK
jgi:sugar phosphate permease